MSSQIGGQPAFIENSLPAPVNITLTTAATPTVITTATAHGLQTGDYFTCSGATDTNLNGAHLMAGTVTSTTVVVLQAPGGTSFAGTGGGAVGTLIPQDFGTTFAIPSGGDKPSAASVNVAFEALADRTAYLMFAKVSPANDYTWTGDQIFDGDVTMNANVTLGALSVTSARGAWNFTGTSATHVNSGGTVTFDSSASLTCASGSTTTVAAAQGVHLTGTAPAVNADPGANNIAIGLNQCKAWASLLSDGVGGVTAPRGMNISSVAVSGSAAGWAILWARAMDSNDYSITATHRLLAGTPTGPWFAQVELQSSLGFTVNIYKHDGTPADVTADTFACGIQVEAKQ